MTQIVPVACLIAGALTGGAAVWLVFRHRIVEATKWARAETATEVALLSERLATQVRLFDGTAEPMRHLEQQLGDCIAERQQLQELNARQESAGKESWPDG